MVEESEREGGLGASQPLQGGLEASKGHGKADWPAARGNG